MRVFGHRDWSSFWEVSFLPKWLPLLVGLCLGPIAAFLMSRELWHYAAPAVLAIPAAILFIRYPFVAVVLWMLALPYFLNEPTAAGRFVYWMLHRAMVPAALGVVILSDWLGIREKVLARLGWVELVMLGFLGLTLANILMFAPDPVSATIRFYDLLFVPFCMYWVVRLTVPTSQDIKRFLLVAWVTVLAQCGIGLLSWFAPEVLPPQWITGLEGARTVGTLRNPAVYTSTLLFLSLMLLQYAVRCKSSVLRLGLLFAFGLAIYCVFMSFSRASWIGGSVVLVGLIVMYPKVVFRMTIVVVILVSVLGSSILAQQVAWAYERMSGDEAARSAESRVTTNTASMSMIMAKPVFGWGFGNYDRYDRQFQVRVNDIPVRRDETSHNTYLSILAELGLIGFSLYIFPLGWWSVRSVRAWRRLPRDGFGGRSWLAMLWLLLVHMIIVTNFMDMIRFHLFGTTIWWMALAFVGNIVDSQLEFDNVGVSGWVQQLAARL